MKGELEICYSLTMIPRTTFQRLMQLMQLMQLSIKCSWLTLRESFFRRDGLSLTFLGRK